MLRVIQFFSEKRPELLLSVSKTFLILNSQHSEDESRICSTALAKYVLEKWKNAKNCIQE
jgi:hypothetical protein